MSINKKVQKQIEKIFKNETKDAHKISTALGVPRRAVMAHLESTGLRTYSPGSYN